MITSIEKICGIGKYDYFVENVPIMKNQIFFGFNGSGKSTLSDILYSLSDDKYSGKLMERKTLQREDGTTADNPEVVFGTDQGFIAFRDGKWDVQENVFVFNDQYIEDYVTLIQNHDIEKEQLVLGKEGTRLLKTKKRCETEIVEKLSTISSVILNNKEIAGILGLGKSKISLSTKNLRKKLGSLGILKLYSEAQKTTIEQAMKKSTVFNRDYQEVSYWLDLLNPFQRYFEVDASKELKNIQKVLKSTPNVTNKEIATHISKYMSTVDVNWLVTGMNNRADASHCPFCGQELKGKKVEKLSRNLDKFIKGKQKQKADNIVAFIKRVEPYLIEENVESLFGILQKIYNENCERKLLHKSTLSVLEKMCLGVEFEPGCFHGLLEIVAQKRENPYRIIDISVDDQKILQSLIKTIKSFDKLRKCLDDEIVKIKEKIEKTKEYEKTKALYEASFGENSDNFSQMIADAKRVLELLDKIESIQKNIDELAETQRIDGINMILEELNVNYRVCTEDNKFYVRIIGYVPAEYDKNNTILCSEGERRMLAFAYFMQKVMSSEENKTIVIDDPVSSLDMNRKSVVAYKIMQLMESEQNQVIVLSHDISFVEKLNSLINSKISTPGFLEIKKKCKISPLNLAEYLVSEKTVYESIIQNAIESESDEDRIIGLMAMRPYAYVSIPDPDTNIIYKQIELNSTYFHHSRYATGKRICFEENKYNVEGLRAYCQQLIDATNYSFDVVKMIPEDFSYNGLNYESAWKLYSMLPSDNLLDVRKKALVFRVLLETMLFMLTTKTKLDPEHIGKFYNNASKGAPGMKRKLCIEIKKLYDLSKKYHHGADEGSTLGLSALNPDEMEYFDQSMIKIHDWIEANLSDCNPNRNSYNLNDNCA